MSSETDRVFQLGRDLSEALDRSDVVGRWMSHHLAELISRSEENPTNEELASTTRDVVLKLWEHKSGAPLRRDPYAYVKPVLRAIERLDPNPDPWAFYRPFNDQAPSDKSLATYPLLKMACEIDREVGDLIRLLVGLAARDALTTDEAWVIAGKDTAKTEEDRAVRNLDQLVRRLRYQAEEGSDEASALASEEIEQSGGQISSSAHASTEDSTDNPKTDDTKSTGAIRAFDSTDPLTQAAQRAVVQCGHLVKQLEDLCATQPL